MRIWKDPLFVIAVLLLTGAAGYIAWHASYQHDTFELLKQSPLPVVGWAGLSFFGILLYNALSLAFFWIIGEHMAVAAKRLTACQAGTAEARRSLSVVVRGLPRAVPALLVIVLLHTLLWSNCFTKWNLFSTVSAAETILKLPLFALTLLCLHLVFQRSILQPWISLLMAFAAVNFGIWHPYDLQYYWQRTPLYKQLPDAGLWALGLIAVGLGVLWLLLKLMIASTSRPNPMLRWLVAVCLVWLPVIWCLGLMSSPGRDQLAFLPFPVRLLADATYTFIFPTIIEAAGYGLKNVSLLSAQLPVFGAKVPALPAIGAYVVIYGLALAMWITTANALVHSAAAVGAPPVRRFTSSHVTLWVMRLFSLVAIASVIGFFVWFIPFKSQPQPLDFEGVFEVTGEASAGAQIPRIVGFDLVSKAQVSVNDYRGRWLILDFMSSG